MVLVVRIQYYRIIDVEFALKHVSHADLILHVESKRHDVLHVYWRGGEGGSRGRLAVGGWQRERSGVSTFSTTRAAASEVPPGMRSCRMSTLYASHGFR